MKNSKALKIFLFVSGLILLIIGLAMLVIPVEFSLRNGSIIGDNINLLNDTRAAGGGLFASGLVIVLGVFFRNMAFTSTIVSMMAYISYGMGRAISLALDGIPVDGLVKATIVEILIGLIGVIFLYKYRNNENE